MPRCSQAKLRRLWPVVAIGIIISSAAVLCAQKIDLNANGMSDVWEWIYGNGNMDPAADADGDGMSNLQESIAGTNPSDSNSVPRVSFTGHAGPNLLFSIPSALGKQYQLQSVLSLDSASMSNWTAEATLVARTGSVVTLSAPPGVNAKFFRIAVSDVDTDGDGVSDWEEYQLGLDPFNPLSNGQIDLNGQPMNDRAYVTGKLASQNVITITATDPTANQPDPSQNAINLGLFTITRGGFPLNAISVNLGLGGPGNGFAAENVDFVGLPRPINFPVGVSSRTINVIPLANTNRMVPANAMLKVLPGLKYSVGTASNASIVIYPTATTKGTGLTGQYYTNANVLYSSNANFNPANLKLTRLDSTVDFTWGTGTTPITNGGYYSVRWTGQVQPQYSETYYFVANTDDGVKLWVNDQLIIDNWAGKSASDLTGTINLQAGVRYDIKMEYFQLTGSAVAHLSWYSADQPKQIIPSSRLYPTNVVQAATQVISPLTAVAFLGQAFSYTVSGANLANSFSATGLPPGLAFNTTNGVINGTPTLAGDYQVSITASNSLGVGASVVDIQVIDTGTSVTLEVWTNVPGTNVADIPLTAAANITTNIGTLENITNNYAGNYGERIRGYLTAPVTGNYYFWLAASDSAELWISNDSEPGNKVRRSFVSPQNPTASRQWTLMPNQKSGWLTLVAGQRYYLEILHKAGLNPGDNWSVGWLQDPTGTNTTPAGVVPGYVLSKYFTLPPSLAPGTLYSADMVTGPGVTNMGTGSATIRLSADNTRASLSFSFSGVPSAIISEHIVNDSYLGRPTDVLFDISAARPQPDGTFNWPITATGDYSAADVLEILNEGKAYITILTSDYPNGELNGHFSAVQGSPTFTPPAAPPAWTDDHANSNAASRFLIQATFGPSTNDVASVQLLGYDGWINDQFTRATNHHLPFILANVSPDPSTPYPGNTVFNTWWQQSITASDQLRQRLAFALSEIMVVSDQGTLLDNGRALSYYYDTLLDNAFGNYRQLLEAVTLTPTMGLYLDMRGNDMGSMITGIHANENYAREIQQLFSLGLNRFWPDGTLVLDSTGNLVPTYDQNVIMGVASVFTGWNYWQPFQTNGHLPTSFSPAANYTSPMVLVPTHHELGTKLLLDNVVLPPAWGLQTVNTTTNFDSYCLQDLESALDSIFYNQNVGPFICRELIQRLVTSTPSHGYIYRVVQKFNDNGSGVRGDMQAVIKAILLDYEARGTAMITQTNYGKQREPLLRVTATARAFPSPATFVANYSQSGDKVITISNTTPHRLSSTSDTIFLTFTDGSGNPAPEMKSYTVNSIVRSNVFTVTASGISSGTYTQAVNINITNVVGTTTNVYTTNTITANMASAHGLSISNTVYLAFTNGAATSGIYQLIAVPDTTHLTVATPTAVSSSGGCVMPKFTSTPSGYAQTKTNVTFGTSIPHGLNIGDGVFVNFTAAGAPADGVYQVTAVPDPTHFSIVVALNANQNQNGQTIYPLIPPPLVRSGTVAVQFSTWAMNATDGTSSTTPTLSQSPLNSPTVFNFFFPDYKFPGPLATAGLTTPEFQLTSDTSVANQMNFLYDGLLGNNSSNTNGMSSLNNGTGAIVLDLGPWMTPAYTSNAGIPSLVDALNSLLCAGQLSAGAKAVIVNYVANVSNFPYSSPPANSQMRDRVRAVVHLLIDSPDFTIQK